jgi:hypothetical protein
MKSQLIYGLDKDSAEWWMQYEIARYGNGAAESIGYCYADAFEMSVLTALNRNIVVDHETIQKFSKITINNVFPLFDASYEFYIFLVAYGSEILKFLTDYKTKSNKYLVDIIARFVTTNYYYYFCSFGDLVLLFPDNTVDDSAQLEKWCDEVIAANPKAVADYKGGKMGALNSLKGQVMKLSKGTAKIDIVGNIILSKIN